MEQRVAYAGQGEKDATVSCLLLLASLLCCLDLSSLLPRHSAICTRASARLGRPAFAILDWQKRQQRLRCGADGLVMFSVSCPLTLLLTPSLGFLSWGV